MHVSAGNFFWYSALRKPPPEVNSRDRSRPPFIAESTVIAIGYANSNLRSPRIKRHFGRTFAMALRLFVRSIRYAFAAVIVLPAGVVHASVARARRTKAKFAAR